MGCPVLQFTYERRHADGSQIGIKHRGSADPLHPRPTRYCSADPSAGEATDLGVNRLITDRRICQAATNAWEA
jgi:hypothetical protein